VNRPAVAQTFEHTLSAKKFTVVGNQFAARACTEESTGELLRNQNDGQACASLARREATSELLNWLATNPTTDSTAPVIVAGDFNAYSLEDPVRLIKQAGYLNVAESFVENPYTAVVDGMVGSLDHIFLPSSLNDAVVAADTWRVNADEPVALNYETIGKSIRQQNVWYGNDVYRSAERNPVVVRLDTGLMN